VCNRTDRLRNSGFEQAKILPILNAVSTFALPAGNSTLLTAKLLTPAEYGYVAALGLEGAQHLAELFRQNGTHHLSSLTGMLSDGSATDAPEQ